MDEATPYAQYNKCIMCKLYFIGFKGRMYCRVCEPTEITEDQPDWRNKNVHV